LSDALKQKHVSIDITYHHNNLSEPVESKLDQSEKLRDQIKLLKLENQELSGKIQLLEANFNYLQILGQNLPLAILFQNTDLVYTWGLNSAFAFESDQFLGKSDMELLSPSEAGKVTEIKKSLLIHSGTYTEKVVRTNTEIKKFFHANYKTCHDNKGEIIGLVTIIHDGDDYMFNHSKLEHQLAGEELVASIAAKFINAEIAQLDLEIPAALKEMAEYIDADRGFIRFLNIENTLIEKGYEWKSPNLKPGRLESAGLYLKDFPSSMQQLEKGIPIFMTDKENFDSEAMPEHDFFNKAGYGSLVIFPLFLFNRLFGYLGFGSENSRPLWSERERGLLDLFRSIITSALERHHRETEYNEVQSLYQNLVNLSPNAIFLIQNGEFRFVNPVFTKVIGAKSTSDLLGKHINEIDLHESFSFLKTIAEQPGSRNIQINEEITVINPLGETFTLGLKTVPIIINGLSATLGIGVDFTKRIEYEIEIQENRKFLTNILHTAPMGIFVFDRKKDGLLFFNNALEKVIGFSSEELRSLGREQIFDLLKLSDRKISQENILKVNNVPYGEVVENEVKILNKNNESIWLHLYQTPITKDEAGTTEQSLTILQDITEIKKAQEEVRKSETDYRGLVESVPGIVYKALFDEAFTTIYLSDYFEKLTSIPKIDLLGKAKYKWSDIVHPEDIEKATKAIHLAIQCQSQFEVEYRLMKADGTYAWVNDTGTVICAENNNPLYLHGIMTDISDRKRDYEEMRRLSQENFRLMTKAYHDAETKSLLLDEVNHRVKNNLSAILGILELESRQEIKTTEDFRSVLSDIGSRINGLATVHKVLSSNQWAPLLLESLARKVIENACATSPVGRTIQIEIISHDKKMWINPRQATSLALVLNELTTNSIRHGFANKSKGLIKVIVQITDKKTRRVKVEFSDNGPGWPEEIIAGNYKSVGMQVITLAVASPLNGTIKFENRNGAVATIVFNLTQQRELFSVSHLERN
jgi:PAS domain S-box-containing protein